MLQISLFKLHADNLIILHCLNSVNCLNSNSWYNFESYKKVQETASFESLNFANVAFNFYSLRYFYSFIHLQYISMANGQHQQQATLGALAIPSMTNELDSYLKEIIEKIEAAEQYANKHVRTTNFTVIDFEATKQDRLWAMKTKEEFIDAVLITADGSHREVMMHFVQFENTFYLQCFTFYAVCSHGLDCWSSATGSILESQAIHVVKVLLWQDWQTLRILTRVGHHGIGVK